MRYCDICGYSTKNISNFKRHFLAKHPHLKYDGKRVNRTGDDGREGADFLSRNKYNIHSHMVDNYHDGRFIDIRLKENFKLFISGPSRCGKTVFVAKLIENIQSFAKQAPTLILYVYKVWQDKTNAIGRMGGWVSGQVGWWMGGTVGG